MPSLIPVPVRHETREGWFDLARPLRVVAPEAVADAADRVAESLRRAGSGAVEVVMHDDGAPGAVVLTLGDATPPPPAGDGRRAGADVLAREAYSLSVDADRIVLEAAHPDGLLRGLATLDQLAGAHHEEGDAPGIGAVVISDAPRYAWRGLMVDISRHFFGVDVLRDVVDLLALYKLNVLHLHLSDDQGWRLDLGSRPELVKRSGGTEVGGGAGGYLTPDDYVGLVAYAAERGVVVVPEIDLPGHTNAALHAVPELNPSGEAAPAYTGIEVGFSALDLALPATEPFLRDVLGEVASLTAGEFVHIGGDEVKTLSREAYAQFVETAAAIVVEHGKRPVLWEEGGKASLPEGAVVQLWESNSAPDDVVAAAERGARVVMSPGKHVYLDMKYHADYPLGLAWAGLVDVRDSYEWDPDTYAPGLDPAAIDGVEAALWTETITTREELFTMLLPRLAAVAEVAWTAQTSRSFDDVAARLAGHAPLWRSRDWAYHPSDQVPWAG